MVLIVLSAGLSTVVLLLLSYMFVGKIKKLVLDWFLVNITLARMFKMFDWELDYNPPAQECLALAPRTTADWGQNGPVFGPPSLGPPIDWNQTGPVFGPPLTRPPTDWDQADPVLGPPSYGPPTDWDPAGPVFGPKPPTDWGQARPEVGPLGHQLCQPLLYTPASHPFQVLQFSRITSSHK